MRASGPITEPCPGCGQTAVLALDTGGDFVYVDPDDAGTLAGAEDGNGFAWVRPVRPGEQLALDDRLYRPHGPSCRPRVISITAARSYRDPHRARGRTA